MKSLSFVLLAAILASPVHAEVESPAVQSLGGSAFVGWKGLVPAAEGATFPVPGVAAFRFPEGPRGFYKHGYSVENDSTANWTSLYGVQCEVKLADAREIAVTVAINAANRNGGESEPIKSTVRLTGSGWHTVTLPWSAFGFDQARTVFLNFVRGVSVSAEFTDGGQPGRIVINNVRAIQAPAVGLTCAVRGKAAAAGHEAEYAVVVSNCTDRTQSIVLSLVHYGWEMMTAAPEPSALQLAPGESKSVTLRVKVSERVPPGGHEEQVLQAVANGDAVAAAKLSFITVSEVPSPFILHTSARWQEVRDKVKNYPWAQDLLADYRKQADGWKVPEVVRAPSNDPKDGSGPYLFATTNETPLMASGIVWQLTRERRYAEKIAVFLRRLSNPADGYPATWRGSNQSEVQEGHFFQHVAMAYDMIQDSGVLSPDDRRQIEATFRLFMRVMDFHHQSGSINNWNLSEATGAFYCALALQDLTAAERFFSGPSGIKDELSKGTLDDGWWYECSISYNMWCASEFTQAALAYQPFGINFKDLWVPASYSPHVLLVSELNGGNQPKVADPEQRRKPFGMDPDVYGPVRRPYRTITDLWNSLLPFLDYRGVMFGVNDSTEARVGGHRTEVVGQPFELAYYVFRDPAYAAVIKLGGGKRDLLYGVPELPEKTPENFRKSAYADNVGLATLRSQTENRPIREQIQATLHYGTHGWAHGHFDRTDLISLMRYGRSFYNPESVFYVYEPFMYKFYTQTSLNHNMVVVDQKMQEAAPAERAFFHAGKMMQATVVQVTARWSNPPYGGMVYDYVPVKTFEEKTWREGRYVPIPENAPVYGTLTDFTEPVLQRRLMIVTDDYVVLADYAKGARPHTFESLLQLKGFKGLEAPQKKILRHDAQWSTDPVGSAQFVTDCDWYSTSAPAKSRFEMSWGAGADNAGTRTVANEDGVLKMDVHSLWPLSQEIMVGAAPEFHHVEKRLFYTVRGDGRVLAGGKFGAWILGQGNIDVSVDGVKQLELETKTELASMPTLFWAGARIVTRDGKEIPLGQLPVKRVNVAVAKAPGQDYFGGPIKIAGNLYADGIAAEPENAKEPGLLQVDLSGVDAVRFKVVVGGDYPPGPEAARRKVYAIRAARGTEARFLTVIEPYEDKPVVKSAEALGADKLRVELADGRVQEITLKNFAGDGTDISADIVETKNGKILRTETAEPTRP
ncbi:MAG: alginate lyase family protein [Verrucomicrobia bacterium]|nr:alginate lyase family protein [Verrucomicrobiota bacterium]